MESRAGSAFVINKAGLCTELLGQPQEGYTMNLADGQAQNDCRTNS